MAAESGSGSSSKTRTGVLNFYFEVRPIRQIPGLPQYHDKYGRWIPHPSHNSHEQHIGTYTYYCNGDTIRRYTDGIPKDCTMYREYTVYFGAGAFWLVDYDIRDRNMAVNQGNYEIRWQLLSFNWDDPWYASYATEIGQYTRLRIQRGQVGQRATEPWVPMLLPPDNHAEANHRTSDQRYGGMNGELPVILALVAFSAQPTHQDWVLGNFRQGYWAYHSQLDGRTEGRGMVVKVFAHPARYADLESFEAGKYGKIFP